MGDGNLDSLPTPLKFARCAGLNFDEQIMQAPIPGRYLLASTLPVVHSLSLSLSLLVPSQAHSEGEVSEVVAGEVEVSEVGQLFRKIGWVHGVGNSSEA